MPIIRLQGSPGPTVRPPTAPVDTSGAQIAGAIGEAASSIGGMLSDKLEEHVKELSQEQLARDQADIRAIGSEMLDEAANMSTTVFDERSAEEIKEEMKAQFAKRIADEVGPRSRTGPAGRAVGILLSEYGTELNTKLDGTISNKERQYSRDTLDTAAEKESTSVRRISDVETAQEFIDTIYSTGAAGRVFDKGELEDRKRRYKENTAFSAAKAHLAEQPGEAARIILRGGMQGKVSPENEGILKNAAAREVDQMIADLDIALDKSIQVDPDDTRHPLDQWSDSLNRIDAVEQTFKQEMDLFGASRSGAELSLFKDKIDATRQAVADRVQAYSIGGLISAGRLVSGGPTSPETKIAEQVYIPTKLGQIRGLPLEDQARHITKDSVRFGYMPEGYRNYVASLMNPAATPEQFATGAFILQQLGDASPRLIDGVSKRDVDLASFYGTLRDAGYTDAQAAEVAAKLTANPDTNVLLADYTAQKLGDENADQLRDYLRGSSTFDPLGPGDVPEIPPQMYRDYDRLVQASYLRGVSIEAARESAAKQLQTSWGVTRIGGERRIQKFAPEHIYNDEKAGGWIRTQLVDDLRGQLADPSTLSLDNIELFALDDPDNPASRYKVYMVMERFENGLIQERLGKNGQPIIFRPDFTESPEYKMKEIIGDLRGIKDPRKRADAVMRLQLQAEKVRSGKAGEALPIPEGLE